MGCKEATNDYELLLGKIRESPLDFLTKIPLSEMDISGAKIKLDANGIPVASGDGYVNIITKEGNSLWISKTDADIITRTINNGIDAGKYITFNMETTNAPRNEFYTSPDAALDFLLDREKGVLPEKAGIIALRTTVKDLENPDMIGAPFRYEHDAQGKSIVYDERVVASGTKAGSTLPTDLSLSGKGITDGATGETLTYYPRTKTNIPMLWFATDSAREVGLGAPTLTQVKAINWLAFKDMVGNILHPHIAEDIKFTWGDIKAIKGSLIDFYRDTYEWKGKSETEVLKAVNEQTEALAKEAVDNLNAMGLLKDASPEKAQELIDNEVSKIVSDRVKGVMENQKVMKELAKTQGSDIAKTYLLSVKGLLDTLTDVTLIGSSASNLRDETESVGQKSSQGVTEKSGVTTSVLTPSRVSATILLEPSLSEITTKLTSLTTPAVSITKVFPTTKGTVTILSTKTVPPTTGTTPPTTKTVPPPTITTPPPTKITPPPTTIIPPPTTKIPPRLPIVTVKPLSPSEQKREAFAGSLIWKQGFGFWAIKSPYATQNDIAFFKTPPRGATIVEGAGAAYRSIQQLTGKPPSKELKIPLGVVTVTIKNPQYKAGASGAIKYKMNVAAKRGKATGVVRIVS
jgi:hypothetical protein